MPASLFENGSTGRSPLASHRFVFRAAGAVAVACGLFCGCDGSTLDVLRSLPDGGVASVDGSTPPPQHTTGELIHYGVDTPVGLTDLQWLLANRGTVDDGVYDGLVLDMGAETLASNQPLALDEASSLLANARFTGLVDNFQVLRIGELSMSDDDAWKMAIARAKTIAIAARAAKLRGFFFDTQQETLFRNPKGSSFEASETTAKRRGYDLMSALLEQFPNATFLTSLAFVSVFVDSCFGGAPVPDQQYALLGAFLDGMLAARADLRSSAELVDAFLLAYPTRNLDAYRLYYDLGHFDWKSATDHWTPGIVTYRFVWNAPSQAAGERAWPNVATSTCAPDTAAKLQRNLAVGFGIAIDYDRGTGTPLRGDATDYRPPEALRAHVARALATSDRYVWTWSGHSYFALPRTASSPSLPAAYRAALREGKALR